MKIASQYYIKFLNFKPLESRIVKNEKTGVVE